jgi:hypothetical protein
MNKYLLIFICIILAIVLLFSVKNLTNSEPCQNVCHREVEICVYENPDWFPNSIELSHPCEQVWNDCLDRSCGK